MITPASEGPPRSRPVRARLRACEITFRLLHQGRRISRGSCQGLAMSDPPPAITATSVPTPKPRLRTVDRQQLLPAMPLEDLLDTDHQARVVWDFVVQLDLSPLYAQIRSVEGGPGRPAID